MAEQKVTSFDELAIKAEWERSIGEFGSQTIHTLRTRKYKEILDFFTADENQHLAYAIVFHLAQHPNVDFESYATLVSYTPEEVEELLESGLVGNQEFAEDLTLDKPLDQELAMYQELLKLFEKEPSLYVPFVRDVILYSKAGFNLDMLSAFAKSDQDVHQVYETRFPREASVYKQKKQTASQEEVALFPMPVEHLLAAD